MVMNGFDTNFDQANEIYAVNTVGFHYLYRPVVVKRGELVRIYLVNILEFDQINSFHIHANFFHYFPTGTSLTPSEYTDTIVQARGSAGSSNSSSRIPAGTCSTRTRPSSRSSAGWASSRCSASGGRGQAFEGPPVRGARLWLYGLLPLALLALVLGLFFALGGTGIGKPNGAPPQEELTVERTVLRPGEIELRSGTTDWTTSPSRRRWSTTASSPSPAATSRSVISSRGSSSRRTPGSAERRTRSPSCSRRGDDRDEHRRRRRDARAPTSFYGLMALLGTYVGSSR